MPPEPFPDSSNSHENDQKVRFVDTDLSIQPSHHGAPDKENEANERGADKYYKDMQSIHGDTVPPLQHLLSVIPLFRRLHFTTAKAPCSGLDTRKSFYLTELKG